MVKASIHGLDVVIYEFSGDQARCHILEVGVTAWYRLNDIEVSLC